MRLSAAPQPPGGKNTQPSALDGLNLPPPAREKGLGQMSPGPQHEPTHFGLHTLGGPFFFHGGMTKVCVGGLESQSAVREGAGECPR